MLSDSFEKLLVWLCALIFCLLIWAQIFQYINRTLDEIKGMQDQIEVMKRKMESNKIIVDQQGNIRYE
jgi:hypothetical protein